MNGKQKLRRLIKVELKELDEKTDMLLMMEFRQSYAPRLWKKFCREQGYESELRCDLQ